MERNSKHVEKETKIKELKAEAYDLIVTQQKINLRLQQIGQELDKI